jgi:hypothetical protein
LAKWWPRQSLSNVLHDRPPLRVADAPDFTHVFARLSDCRGNVSGFSACSSGRPSRVGISLSDAWVIGSAIDADSVRRMSTRLGWNRTDWCLALSMWQLAARRTPFIIVFDSLGRVRLVADVLRVTTPPRRVGFNAHHSSQR